MKPGNICLSQKCPKGVSLYTINREEIIIGQNSVNWADNESTHCISVVIEQPWTSNLILLSEKHSWGLRHITFLKALYVDPY